jgi:hypothetical protein
MEKGFMYEPPRRLIPVVDDPPPLALGPGVPLVEVPLVEVPLAVDVPRGVPPVAPLPVALERGAPPACGEPAAAWVWWCSGRGVVTVAVPVWAVSFMSAMSVGMNRPPFPEGGRWRGDGGEGLPEL